MGNKIPELDGNVSGKNGISRRAAITKGMGAIMASLLGSGTLPAQDNAVAVVTNPQNVPGRSLETVATQSGFAKTITGLQAELAALQDEFKKGNIDSKKMEELLTKLLLNEKTITIEVQKTLDVIFERLGKTYALLSEGDKRKAEIKELGNTIINMKTGLMDEDNLIKAVRFICDLCGNEKFRNETLTLNKQYFKGIIDYFDTTTSDMVTAISKYEASFHAMPSEEIKDFKKRIVLMKEKPNPQDLTPSKGTILVEIKSVDDGGTISLNRGFGDLANGSCTIQNGELVLVFNGARDGYAGSTNEIKIPDKSKKVGINFSFKKKVKSGDITPLYLIFTDNGGKTISDIALKEKTNGISLPKGATGIKLAFGTLRQKATGTASIGNLEIDFK